jgi:hypothetical protein
MTSQASIPPPPLPPVPFNATGVQWDVYRNELRLFADRSVITMQQYQVLLKESYNEELFPELSTRAKEIPVDHVIDGDSPTESAQRGAVPAGGSRAGAGSGRTGEAGRSSGDHRYIPVRGHRVRLAGPRLREAAVLIVRLYPGVTSGDVLVVLRRSGFDVAGPRPVEVLRKALRRETEGVRGRVPTLTLVSDQYSFIEGSLTVRTTQRWEHRFPTLTAKARRIAA